MKRFNKKFQDQMFGHKVAFKHLHKGLQPLPTLVYIGRVFNYQIVTSGGHVYPILSKELTFFQNNCQTTRSI